MRHSGALWFLVALSCDRATDAPRLWEPADHQHTTEPSLAVMNDPSAVPQGARDQAQTRSVARDDSVIRAQDSGAPDAAAPAQPPAQAQPEEGNALSPSTVRPSGP